MKKIFLILLGLFLITSECFASHKFKERYYQNQWCTQWHGRQEVKLIDGTRIDCETKNYAVEFDFARKWAEAIGQSLHYARMTGKKPAIVLIIEDSEDFKYYHIIKPLCENYNITLWYMKPPQNSKETIAQGNIFDYREILNILFELIKDFILSII